MLSLIAMSVVLNFCAARQLPFSMAHLAVVVLNLGVYLLYALRFSIAHKLNCDRAATLMLCKSHCWW